MTWQRVRTDPVSRSARMQALLDALPPPAVSPVNTVAPTISGDFIAGQVWTATEGTWTGTAPLTYTYQWYRSDVAITGATDAEYPLSEADFGNTLSVIVTATNEGGSASAESAGSLIPAGLAGSSVSSSTFAGGAISFAASGGASAPAAPVISGLTLAADFDFGAQAAGAFPTEVVPLAGSLTTARAVVGGDAPTIVTLANGRRAVDFDGTNDWVQITNAVSVFNTTDAQFTVVVVAWLDVAGVAQGVFSATKGIQSGASTVNRHDLFIGADNSHRWRRANAAATFGDALFGGAPSLTAPNIYIMRGSTNVPDQRNRGMHNGGTKVQGGVVGSVESPAFTQVQIGARMINNPVAYSSFMNGKIERLIIYTGSATDSDMDTIQTAMAAYYTA